MMQQLRESTKVIMVLVAVSFVGLMVFEWGMDFSGRSSQQGTGTTLGSVDGADISVEEYQRQYQILYEQAQAQAPEGLSREQLEQIEQQAALTLREYPNGLTLERQRLIMAIAKQLQAHIRNQLRGGPREPIQETEPPRRHLHSVDSGSS